MPKLRSFPARQHRVGQVMRGFSFPLAWPTRADAPAPSHSRPHASRRLVQEELRTRILAGQRVVQPAGNSSWGYRVFKRTLDLLGAATLLVLLAPVLLVTYVVLWFTTRGKPLFVQERVGHCGRLFRMYKFRTMIDNAEQVQQQVENEMDGPVFKNRHDPRVTRVGRILRKLSIDELPQLFNVLRGDMSLVGPRPPVLKEVVKYEPWQLKRLSVKPGLTCIWQVSGRNEIGFAQWVRMDLEYIRNQSWWLDLSLLLKTPWAVLTGRGAY